VYVEISTIILQLFFHIFLVKMNGAGSKLLIVNDLSTDIQYILFELLLKKFLGIYSHSQISNLICETLLPHSKVVDDQSQILIHPVKVFKF
jgi:hypothetical protein